MKKSCLFGLILSVIQSDKAFSRGGDSETIDLETLLEAGALASAFTQEVQTSAADFVVAIDN